MEFNKYLPVSCGSYLFEHAHKSEAIKTQGAVVPMPAG
jgi:hypothetical protein